MRKALGLLVLASAVSIAIHAYVAPEHFEEFTDFGRFFVALTAVQILWTALVVARPTTGPLVLGIVLNLAIVGLWLFTRFVEVPIGPEAGEVEAVGLLDSVATGAEIVVAIVCGYLIGRRGNA